MYEVQKGTTITVGITEEHRYVGVTPPLNNEEIDDLYSSSVLLEQFIVELIDEDDTPITLIRVSDDSDILRSPNGKTQRAVVVARKIADTLSYSRGFDVNTEEDPVKMLSPDSIPNPSGH